MKNKKLSILIVLPVIVAIYLIFKILINIQIPCIFKELTGLYCAGCGITRMFISLLNLEFYQAFRYNPYSFIILPIILLYLYFEIIELIFKKKNPMNKKKFNKLWYILLIGCIIFMIIRNIDIFSYLIPTKI